MKPERIFRLGVIVNPFAGIGGEMALKGSDGAEIRNAALAMGASQQAMAKTEIALSAVVEHKDRVHLYLAAGDMGQTIAEQLDLDHSVVYSPSSEQTQAEDTKNTVRALLDEQVDLILFAGGDGTARNIFEVADARVPVLGVPAGCKIHSGVYGVTPQATGRVLAQVVTGQIVSVHLGQVMDIDEALFRQGTVKAKFYGEMQVPEQLEYIQAVKMGGKESDELVLADIAAHVIELMDEHPEALFVMGSGSTVDFIMQEMGVDNTLLGVDIVQNQQLLKKDVSAAELLEFTQCEDRQSSDEVADTSTKQNDSHGLRPCFLVITLIGGQGHILGRGNQQLSAAFIAQLPAQNMVVVATKTKLQQLNGKPLIADSGDLALNQSLSGLITVTTGYRDQVLYPVM